MKLSVIIPCYNTAPYLHRCIDSVIAQTYSNLEIILVDDGSTDDTPEVCDEYATKDVRIHVIHKTNGGVSEARNVALEIATGEFVTFIDSDDYVEPYMYEEMMAVAKQSQTDIVQCGHIRHKEKEWPALNENSAFMPVSIYTGVDFFAKFLHEGNSANVLYTSLCNKVYRIQLFKNLAFPIGRVYEDEAVIHRLFLNAATVGVTDKKFYHYIVRENSIVKDRSIKSYSDKAEALYERLLYIRKEFPAYTSLETRAAQQYYWFCKDSVKEFYTQQRENTAEARAFIDTWLTRSASYFAQLRLPQKAVILLIKLKFSLVQNLLEK